MKNMRRSFLVFSAIFFQILSFSTLSSSWASSTADDVSDLKILISEIKGLREDIRLYNIVNYKLQASLGKMQLQIENLSTIKNELSAVSSEITSLIAQNNADEDELDNLKDQLSSFNQSIEDKSTTQMQISNINNIMADREKLINKLREKEASLQIDFTKEEASLDAIISYIEKLEPNTKRR